MTKTITFVFNHNHDEFLTESDTGLYPSVTSFLYPYLQRGNDSVRVTVSDEEFPSSTEMKKGIYSKRSSESFVWNIEGYGNITLCDDGIREELKIRMIPGILWFKVEE